jgi:hypothetical protein
MASKGEISHPTVMGHRNQEMFVVNPKIWAFSALQLVAINQMVDRAINHLAKIKSATWWTTTGLP